MMPNRRAAIWWSEVEQQERVEMKQSFLPAHRGIHADDCHSTCQIWVDNLPSGPTDVENFCVYTLKLSRTIDVLSVMLSIVRF